jgi:apolipoprotein N-acyltransferase
VRQGALAGGATPARVGCAASDLEAGMNTKLITDPHQDRWSYVWLLVATVLGLFSLSVGKWLIPVTAWLGAIFLIRFFRTQRRAWLAYLLTAVSVGVSTAVTLPAYMGPTAMPIIIGSSLLGPLVLLADRLLAPRLPGFAGTLVFPLAMTTMDYLNTFTNPFGSNGAIAYSQYDNLAMLQLVSLTGMWGLSFLLSWLGSVANWAWEHEFAWPEIKRGVLLYAGLILLMVAYGEARLWFAPKDIQTVRVAGLTMVDWPAEQSEMSTAFDTDRAAFRRMMEEWYQLYVDATIREARAGAKIISWPENAMTIAKEDVTAMIARLQELAKQEGIYLVAPIIEMTDGSPYANKVIILDPQGRIVLEHYKFGGAGMEGNRINGDGILHTAQTPYGVISGIVCWDSAMQGAVLQAGRNGTDILLTPSITYRDFDPSWGYVSVMRAIENGVSVVHVSDGGLSVMADPYGRILATMDHYAAGERVMVAQVPTKGVWTLYPIIGDLFAWLAIVGLAGVTIWAVVRGRRHRA